MGIHVTQSLQLLVKAADTVNSRGDTEGPIKMPSTMWMESRTDESTMDHVIEHMHNHGAFDEATSLIDRLEAGTEKSSVLSPAQVHERLKRYCGQ